MLLTVPNIAFGGGLRNPLQYFIHTGIYNNLSHKVEFLL